MKSQHTRCALVTEVQTCALPIVLRDERLTVGRFDARYTGVDVDAADENPDFEASSEAISGAYIGSLNGYLTHQLGYETDMTYRLSARDAPGFEWDWSHEAPGTRREQTTPNTAVDLSVAMRTNPYLKVLSLNGYYDMATPFYGDYVVYKRSEEH